MAFENEYVSLEEQKPDTGISLQVSPNQLDLPLEETNLRANKAHLALGDKSPGLDVLQNQFATGQEDSVRQKMSVDLDTENRQKASQMVAQVASTEGPLTPEDVDFTMQVMRTKPQDPSVVLETEFGKKFAQYATTAHPEVNQVFSKAWKYTPAETAFELNVTGNLVAKGSIAQHKLQELEERWKKTPWFAPMEGSPGFELNNSKGAVDAYLHSLIPFVPWSIMRNSLEGMKTESILPGNNTAEQVQSLWLVQDPAQFKQVLDTSLEKLWNKDPLAALTIARAAVTFSASDQLLGNIYGWADIASVAPIGTAINLTRRGIAATSAKLTRPAPSATEGLLNSRYDLGAFNPYAFEVGRVGPASDLLPQSVRDASREIVGRPQKTNFLEKVDGVGSHYESGSSEVYRVKGSSANIEVLPQPDNKNLRIQWMGRGDGSVAEDFNNAANLGPARIRQIGYELKEQYPWAETVTFTRLTGARASTEKVGEEITINLPKGSRIEKGPSMDIKRGQTFDVQRGQTMDVNRGPAWEVPSQEVRTAIGDGIELPLRGPTVPSRLPPREGDPTREQFMAAWARYYQRQPWNAPSDVKPSGEFPAALIPKGQQAIDAEVRQQARNAFWDVVRAGNEKKIDPERALVIIGDIPTAARLGAQRIISTATNPTIAAEATLYDLSKDIPSVFNPQVYTQNLGNMNQESARRLANTLQIRGEGFMEGFTAKGVVERLPPEAQEQAFKEAEKAVRNEFHTLSDYVTNVVRNPRDPFKNTDSVSMQLGDKGGMLFESSDRANLFAKDVFKLPEGSYTIEQQGMSFWVDVRRPVDETLGSVRDLIASTKYSQTPTNWLSSLMFGTWSPRSAEDLLSEFNRAQRHISTHAPQNMRDFFLETAKDIAGLPKRQRNEVQDVLRANRDYVDPVTKDRGKFFNTIGDFQVAFQNKHGKLPNDAQTQAYFSFVQLSDMDWVMRNFGWLRDKERVGIQNHRFQLGEGATPWLEGRILPKLPESAEDAGIFIVKDKGTTQMVRRHDPDFDMNAINKMVNEENFSIIQVANPTVRPLKDLTGEKDIINFVVTNTKETKGLPWKQAEYMPGGHVMYPYEWWVKQPQIAVGRGGKYYYYGDSSIFNFSSEKEARMWAERMDEGRRMLLNNDPNLGSHVSKNLPYTEDEFRNLFKNYLDPELPISHSQSGRSTVQTDTRLKEIDKLKDMRNDLDSSYNLYNQLDRTFLSERDMQLGTISPTGNQLKPWQVEAAPAIDPYPMMNRALGQAIRSRYMTDYKIAAAEEWVEQFGKLLEGREANLRKNPLSILYNGKIAKVADKSASREEMIAAENARARIKDFIGSQSEFESNLSRIESLLMDASYSIGGKGTADYVAAHLLPNVKDPFSYFRAIAFHSKLGLFNPVQLLVQSQSMANSVAVAGPIHGGKGMAAGTLQRYLSLTDEPAIINRAAEMSASFGWNPEHFKESYEGLKSTGLWHVAGETAWKDDVFDPKIFRGGVGTFLDKGTVFFANGERQVRLSAWNSAYSEWRAANPEKTFGNREIGDVLNRADTLSLNMTRASNAAWQKGALSIPGQFLAFNSRMVEMFLGNRLTYGERLQAFMTYSALYGIPVGLSAQVGVVPFYEDVRKEALLKGHVLGLETSDTAYKALNEGLISLTISGITGRDYNVAQRYGPNGTNLFSEAIKGNKSVSELFGGASYAVMRDIWKTTGPLYDTLSSMVMGDYSKFPLLIEDLAAELENVSTVSIGARIWLGAQTGKYVTKNHVKVGDITNMDTIMMGLGLTPQHIQDTFHIQSAMKDIKKLQDDKSKEAMVYYRRGIEAAAKGNAEESKASFTRANAMLETVGLDMVQRSKVFSQVLKNNSSDSMNKVNMDLITKGPEQNRKYLMDKMIRQRQEGPK